VYFKEEKMSGMRKMSIIPHELVEKYLYQQRYKEDTKPLEKHAMNIDREIQQILAKKDMSEYDKAAAYSQLLREYLGAIHSTPGPGLVNPSQDVQPLTTPRMATVANIPAVVPETPPGVGATGVSLTPALFSPLNNKTIVSRVPNYAKAKAKKLVNTLLDDPKLQWDGKGEVSINGEPIKGSSIKNIVHNASSNSKHSFVPVGVESVLSYLKKAGYITSGMITNREWKKELGVHESPESAYKTPRARRKSPFGIWNSTTNTPGSSPGYVTPSTKRDGKKIEEWEEW
jgi:hypothetical protein